MSGDIKGVFVLGLVLAWCVFSVPTVLADNGQSHLVISQIQIEGDGGANDEFVEIYNPTDSCVSLDGWSLQYKSSSGSYPLTSKKNLPNVLVPSHGYFLVSNASYGGSIAADATYYFSLSGSATGATIFLSSSTTAVSSIGDVSLVDRFGYGSAAGNAPAGVAPAVPTDAEKPAADWAYVRTGYVGDNSQDFSAQASLPHNLLTVSAASCQPLQTPPPLATTTPTSTPEILGTSTIASFTTSTLVKIYKFLPNPAGDDPGNEWVEIKNEDSQIINLDGWLLDDKNTGSGPAADALVLSGTIEPGEIKRISLPVGAFALNNSGGDEVNLYWADKTLGFSAAYSATAYDDGVFEWRDGAWQPPTISTPSSGSSGGSSSSGVNYLINSQFKLNEIYANPTGDDPGGEWVEIYNGSNSSSTLENYFLAIGDSDASTNLYQILKNTTVPPLGYQVIFLPKDSITLKNSGTEKVRLLSPQKQLIDFISYADAPENRSWAKNKEGKWTYDIPTPGGDNSLSALLPEVVISEILPSPLPQQDEFVELKNLATTTADIGSFVLRVGTRSKILPASTTLPALGFLVLYEEDLPVALRNSGQEIVLADAYGRTVAQVTYPAAKAGEAYARSDEGTYFWTDSLTPGEKNIMILGAAITEPEPVVKVAKSSKASASAPSASEYSKLLKSNQELGKQISELQEQVGELALAVASRAASNPESSISNEVSTNEPNNPAQSYKYLGLVVVGLGGIYFIAKKTLTKSA